MKFFNRCQKIGVGILFLWINVFINAEALETKKQPQDSSPPLNPQQQAILKVLLPSLSPLPSSPKPPTLTVPLEPLVAPHATKTLEGPSLNALENPAIGQVITVGDLEPWHSAKSSEKNMGRKRQVMMQSLVLIGNASHSQWISRFSEKPYYQIENDDSHQVLTLTIDDVDPRSILAPLDIQNSCIQSIDFAYNTENQLVIKLTLKPMIDVQGLRIMGDRPTEFVLDLSAASVSSEPSSSVNPYNIRNFKTPGPYRPLIKTPSRYEFSEGNDDDSNIEYDHAMQLLSHNKSLEAQRLLSKILKESPNFEKATVALAETYLEQNQSQKALSLLLASPLSNQLDGQDIGNHVDYYTVLAESYRQSSQAKSAAEIYQALLNFGPDNGVWWVGFGMSLDAMGQKDAAVEAFNKAKSLGNLPPALNDYLETKS